jgi:hypothetical protein
LTVAGSTEVEVRLISDWREAAQQVPGMATPFWT